MDKLGKREQQRLSKLRYQDEIIQMHKAGISIREITKKINYRICRVPHLQDGKLGKTTIHQIIKNHKEIKK